MFYFIIADLYQSFAIFTDPYLHLKENAEVNYTPVGLKGFTSFFSVGRFCGDTFTNAILMRVPKKSPNTTARDSVGCRLKCAEIERCQAAVFRPGSKECFWLSTEQYTRTVETTPDDPHFEYVYVRTLCQ